MNTRVTNVSILAAVFCVAVILSSCSRSNTPPQQRETSPPAQAVEVQKEEPPPEKPKIDLAIHSISAPQSVGSNSAFDVIVGVTNSSGRPVTVGNVKLRIIVDSVTGMTNTGAGEAVFRDLGAHSTTTVRINARAPNHSGMGEVHATVKVLLADDDNASNNSMARRIVVN